MTYNSNAIEGNSLTLKETFFVINEGITIKGKPLKDHLEARDHQHALSYLYELVQSKKKQPLSEHLIRTLHYLVIENIDKEFAGVYRNSNVIITGSDHTPPDALEIPAQMNELLQWYRNNQSKLAMVELAALFHHKLVYIHPFFDGNGRSARLVMNIILMQAGFPLVIILKNDRKKYYRVLQQADQGDSIPLVHFIARCAERSLDIYLKNITPITQQREKFLPLAQIAPKTPYSAKYLNLLIRQGKLEAHKEKRNWLTSIESVERYRQKRRRVR